MLTFTHLINVWCAFVWVAYPAERPLRSVGSRTGAGEDGGKGRISDVLRFKPIVGGRLSVRANRGVDTLDGWDTGSGNFSMAALIRDSPNLLSKPSKVSTEWWPAVTAQETPRLRRRLRLSASTSMARSRSLRNLA